MTIRNLYVKDTGYAVILDDRGQEIDAGQLSRPSLLQLHLQVLQALLRGEDLTWAQIEHPEDD